MFRSLLSIIRTSYLIVISIWWWKQQQDRRWQWRWRIKKIICERKECYTFLCFKLATFCVVFFSLVCVWFFLYSKLNGRNLCLLIICVNEFISRTLLLACFLSRFFLSFFHLAQCCFCCRFFCSLSLTKNWMFDVFLYVLPHKSRRPLSVCVWLYIFFALTLVLIG